MPIGRRFDSVTGAAAGRRSGRARYIKSVQRRLAVYGVRDAARIADLLFAEAVKAEKHFTERSTP
jgi:hypothetical protein